MKQNIPICNPIESPHYLVIHGIRQKLTNPAWPWEFASWKDRNGLPGRVETEHYNAGFNAILNSWRNRKMSIALANRVATRQREIRGPVYSIGHSNGTLTQVMTAERLAKIGIRTEAMIVTGSALFSDMEENGLRELLKSGYLGKVFAYCSPDDDGIAHLERWYGRLIQPVYGSLSSRGLMLDGRKVGLQVQGYAPASPGFQIYTRWFPGYSHGEWFQTENRAQTFQTFIDDLTL